MENSKAMMQLDLREIPALYMNLAHHTEKNNNMQKILKECGFKNIQRVEGCICEGNSAAGCSQAHHKGLIQMPPPFVLFEDDCTLNTFRPVIEVPQQADAVYLGIAHWGISNSHSGPFMEYEPVSKDLCRIYNMTSGHSVLYLSKEYVNMCKRIAYHTGYVIKDYQDYGFAEVQRWFNVYALNKPLFGQTSRDAPLADGFLTDYPPAVQSFYDKHTFRPIAISPRSASLRRQNDGIVNDEPIPANRMVEWVRSNRLLFVTLRPLARFYFSVRRFFQ